MQIKRDEALAKHTYFKIGGPADQFIEVKTGDELIEAVQYAIINKVPNFVLGGGSNILITDSGFRGLVIKNRTNKIALRGFTGSATGGHLDLKEVMVQVDSGVLVNQLVRYTLDQGLAGLEDMLGLPGSVGGAVYNNSHHLDKLFGDHILEVQVIDAGGKLKLYHQKDLQFDYDYSILHKTKEIVVWASFRLEHADKDTLWGKANIAVARRAQTQPLGSASSGCIFKNMPLADKMRLGLPTQSVGYLIDKAGLKGFRVGGAYVSDVHANFIVNDGTATSKDVLDLIAQIKEKVFAKFGVRLELEVILIGNN